VDELDRGRRLGEEILAEADRKAARVLAKARTGADAVLEEATRSAAQARERILADAHKKAISERERILRGTELEIRKDSLVRIQACLDGMIPAAIERVRSLGRELCPGWLESMIREGIRIMGQDAAVLRLSALLNPDSVRELVTRLGFGGVVESDDALASCEAIVLSQDGMLRYEILVSGLAREKDREMRQAALKLIPGEAP